MRAVRITGLGLPPQAGEAPEPEPGPGDVLLEVLAASLNPIDIAVGSGRFYGGHPPLPYVPGCEAVGRVRGSESVVWAFGGGIGVARDGGMAELATVPESSLTDVPEGADPALAAALGIAGLAGWMPVAWRAPVRPGETVLVLGATGTSGLVALQGAKALGAGRVVAAGRSAEGLRRAAELGADATVQIHEGGDLAEALREACGERGPTLIVDPLWGAPLEAAVEVAAPGARIVHYGQSAGPTATLASAAVRGKQLDLLGYSDFALPKEVRDAEYRRLVELATTGAISVDLERVPLDGVAEAWRRQSEGPRVKLVVCP